MKGVEWGSSASHILAARLLLFRRDAACLGSYLVLTLKVLEKSFVEICGDAVEQRPQHSLRKLVVVQIFDLHKDPTEGRHSQRGTTATLVMKLV